MAEKWSPEKIAMVKALLDDGWPYNEIRRTIKCGNGTLKRYFPDRGWTKSEGAIYGRQIRDLEREIRKFG